MLMGKRLIPIEDGPICTSTVSYYYSVNYRLSNSALKSKNVETGVQHIRNALYAGGTGLRNWPCKDILHFQMLPQVPYL